MNFTEKEIKFLKQRASNQTRQFFLATSILFFLTSCANLFICDGLAGKAGMDLHQLFSEYFDGIAFFQTYSGAWFKAVAQAETTIKLFTLSLVFLIGYIFWGSKLKSEKKVLKLATSDDPVEFSKKQIKFFRNRASKWFLMLWFGMAGFHVLVGFLNLMLCNKMAHYADMEIGQLFIDYFQSIKAYQYYSGTLIKALSRVEVTMMYFGLGLVFLVAAFRYKSRMKTEKKLLELVELNISKNSH